MAFKIHNKTIHLANKIFFRTCSLLAQVHAPEFVRVHLLSHKYGTFTPLESTDYANFFIPFKTKKKLFSSLFIVLYICWVLSVVSGDCGTTTAPLFNGTPTSGDREKNEHGEMMSVSKSDFPLAFFFLSFKCDNKLSMQLYAIFRWFFFISSSLHIRLPHTIRCRVSEWVSEVQNCDGFIWFFFFHFHRT